MHLTSASTNNRFVFNSATFAADLTFVSSIDDFVKFESRDDLRPWLVNLVTVVCELAFSCLSSVIIETFSMFLSVRTPMS